MKSPRYRDRRDTALTSDLRELECLCLPLSPYQPDVETCTHSTQEWEVVSKKPFLPKLKCHLRENSGISVH